MLRQKISSLSLTEEECYLILIASLTSSGQERNLKDVIKSALKSSVRLPLIQESILQTYLFNGYPRTINAFTVLKESCFELNVDYYLPTSVDEKDASFYLTEGLKLFEVIYRELADKVINHIQSCSEELMTWILLEAYGKVLSRKMLSTRVRELLIVGMLFSMKSYRQLMPHARGVLLCGGSKDDVYECFSLLELYFDKNDINVAKQEFEKFLLSHPV